MDLKSENKNEMKIMEDLKPCPYNPFALENSYGLIPPRNKTNFNIVFSPMDVNEYTAILKMQ